MATLAETLPTPTSKHPVQTVRRFNRFYTRQIGVLQEHLLQSQFSLTEVRVLYELAHRENVTAGELCQDLGLDRGYLSRMLHGFEAKGWIKTAASPEDRRRVRLSLTVKGRQVFKPLEQRSSDQVSIMLSRLSPAQQEKLLAAMHTIEGLLTPSQQGAAPYVLRSHRPGDMGWVVQRHGELYWQEYRYDEHFEALVAEIVAEFIENLDPARERCWIAERDGENVGCIFLVKKSAAEAKLRLLLVEPSTRGLGIGKRLVEECIRFAKEAGYKKVMLWTQSELAAARGIYKSAGFQLVGEERHNSWSRKDLVAETWELRLKD
jgi:DNA-binding MarR family transcriptional regulator/N-acetylglutamate synthase-like GNAT family acetyltransferase